MSNNTVGTSSPERESSVKETRYGDVEQNAMAEAHLHNTTVRAISWQGITVTVNDRETKQPKAIVDGAAGYVEAGQ